MKEKQWVTSPELLPFPYVVLDTDERRGTRVEIDFPNPEPEPTIKDVLNELEKIKAKIGA